MKDAVHSPKERLTGALSLSYAACSCPPLFLFPLPPPSPCAAGMNCTLAKLLTKMGVTLMVPDDAAFAALSAAQKKILQGSRGKRIQVVAFHIWAGASPFSALVGNPPQTKVRLPSGREEAPLAPPSRVVSSSLTIEHQSAQ